MVVVFAIAAMVLTLGRQVRTQALASNNDLAAQKADAAERGAEAYVLSLLTDYRDTVPTLTETDFSAVTVGDSYFWVIRPTYDDSNLPAWGLLDEAGKIDINTVDEDQLLLLPGMTQDIADEIVAWRGAVATSTGAASSTVLAGAASGVKNAPFETIDEMLNLPGVTRDVLFGPATMASTAATSAGTDNSTGGSSTGDWATTHGLFDYLSIWNTQPNTDPTGSARLSWVTHDSTFQAMLIDKLGATTANKVMEALESVGGGGGGRGGNGGGNGGPGGGGGNGGGGNAGPGGGGGGGGNGGGGRGGAGGGGGGGGGGRSQVAGGGGGGAGGGGGGGRGGNGGGGRGNGGGDNGGGGRGNGGGGGGAGNGNGGGGRGNGGNGGGGGGGGGGTVSADFFAFADLVNLDTDDLAKIEPFITGSSTTTSLPGLININTAPRDVLLTLGSLGLSEANVDAILAARPEAVAANPGTIGWIRDAVPTISNVVGLASRITGQGRQFSADIVAASGNGRGFRHVRIVVDTTSSPARIVYRRDLTDRGWPMDKSILDDLRAGLGVNGQVAGSQTTGTAQPAATGAR